MLCFILIGCQKSNECIVNECETCNDIVEENNNKQELMEMFLIEQFFNQEFFEDYFLHSQGAYNISHGRTGFDIIPTFEWGENEVTMVFKADEYSSKYDGLDFLFKVHFDLSNSTYTYEYYYITSFEYFNYDKESFMAFLTRHNDTDGNSINSLTCRGSEVFSPIFLDRNQWKILNEEGEVIDFFNDLQRKAVNYLSAMESEDNSFREKLNLFLQDVVTQLRNE